MSFIRAYAITIWSLLRYQTWFLITLYGLIVLTSSLTIPYDDMDSSHYINIFLSILTIGLWYSFGTGINDIADYEIDKINLKSAKDRPLVRGNIDRKNLLYIVIILGALCLLISWYISVGVLLTSSVFLFLSYAYSIRPFILSRRGGLAQILLPSGYIIYPSLVFIFALNNSLDFTQYALITGLYMQFSSRILLKDYRDVVGDKKNNKITFLLKHGNTRVVNLSSVGLIISSIVFIKLVSSFTPTILMVIFVSTVALGVLRSLMHAKNWLQQKPIIATYGRLCSGINVLLLFFYIYKSGSISSGALIINSLIIVTLFLWSASDISKVKLKV